MLAKRKSYIIFSYIILLTFFFSYMARNTILSYAGLVLMLGLLLFCDIEEHFYIYAFLLPNTHIIKIVGNNSALLGYWLVIAVIFAVIKNKKIFFDVGMLLGIIFHLVTVLFCLIYSKYQFFPFVRLISLAFISGWIAESKNFSSEKLVNLYLEGNLASCIMAFVYNAYHGINSFNINFSSILNDRNYFAITLAFSISVVFMMIYRSKKIKVCYLVYICVFLLCGVLSRSRTFILLCLLIVVMIVMVSNNMSVKKRVGLILLLLLGATAIYFIVKETFLHILMRFQNDNVISGNGRFDVWRQCMQFAFSSFSGAMFGHGDFQNSEVYRFSNVVEHNTLVQSLFTIGIVGTCSLLVVYYRIYRVFAAKKKADTSLVLHFPIIIIVLGYCTINGLYSDNLSFAIIISSVLFLQNEEKMELIEALNKEVDNYESRAD